MMRYAPDMEPLERERISTVLFNPIYFYFIFFIHNPKSILFPEKIQKSLIIHIY